MTVFVFDEFAPGGPPPRLEPTDSIIFHGGPARLAVASFDLGPADVFTTTISFGGRSIAFEPPIEAIAARRNLIFDDGSFLMIGERGDDLLEGGSKDDALFGAEGNDSLNAHDGANVLQGNQGQDTLFAGAGADTLLGGQGNDVIISGIFGTGLDGSEVDPGAFVEAGNLVNGNLGDDTIAGGNGGDLLLGGQGNDLILGGRGEDLLFGNLGDDHIVSDGPGTLFGEDGADTLAARGPDSTLGGGAGADVFGFALDRAPVTGVAARIVDWAAEDAIGFAGLGAGHAYVELMAPDFATALARANQAMATSADPLRPGGAVAVVQVGFDLFAFVATAGSVDADYVILIVGRSLTEVSGQDFL